MWAGMVLVGGVAGTFSALLGVGGGILMVPAMVLISKMEMHRAVGTALAAMLPIVLVGLVRHAGFGNVDARAALWLAAGGMAGASLGAALSRHLPAVTLERLFGLLLMAVSARMLLGR